MPFVGVRLALSKYPLLASVWYMKAVTGHFRPYFVQARGEGHSKKKALLELRMDRRS